MKVFQVFESYPLFYQPYIPPVLDKLSNKIDSKIIAFEGQVKTGEKASVLPSYYYRRIYEKFNQKTNKKHKNLNYLEILAIKQNIDVIHIQHSYLFNKIINLLKLKSEERPKIIITLRGGDTYIKPWMQKRWRDFYKNQGSQVDAFIVMSKNQKDYLMRWGVPEKNIKVIPISFGEKFEIKHKSPNKDKLKLVSVFRMCWEKNITENLRLIQKIKNSGIKVSYDVYGDGPDIGQLYYLRDKFDLNEEVIIHGKLANDILINKLRDFDFILQLSHSESFGMSIVEALTRGVPAIVSQTGGLPEIVVHDHSGFVIDDKDTFDINQIIDLWKNQNSYQKMSQSAINTTQTKFNSDVESQKLIELYQSLIS